MTVDAFVALLWRRRFLVLLLTVLGGAFGFGSAQILPKVYSATATSFVTAVPSTDKGASYESTQFAVSRAKSYTPLLKSPEVLTGIIEELKLPLTLAQLAQQLTAENPTDTLLVNVTAEAGSPELAKRIADSASRHLATEIETLETGGSNQRTSPVDIQLAVPAPMPNAPDSPRPIVNAVLGLLLGFAVAALVTLALPRGRRRLMAVPQPPPDQWWQAPRHVRSEAGAMRSPTVDARSVGGWSDGPPRTDPLRLPPVGGTVGGTQDPVPKLAAAWEPRPPGPGQPALVKSTEPVTPVTPVKPTEPAKAKPAEPVTPVRPAEPVTPVKPTEPAKAKPAEPVTPVTPVTPAEPVTPEAHLLNGAKSISRDSEGDAARRQPVVDPVTRQIPLPPRDRSAATDGDPGAGDRNRTSSATEREQAQKQPQP